jgi:hypothetical protein
MRTLYNHLTYMESIAENLRDIAHSTAKPRFFKSTGLASLDGLLANLSVANLPCLIAEDGCDERLSDNQSDNILGHPFYTFYILYKASPGNDTEIMEGRSKAKATAKKVLSRMRRDAHEPNLELGIDILDLSSVRIQGVGPLGDSGYGVMVTFTMQQDADIVYDTNDWMDE